MARSRSVDKVLKEEIIRAMFGGLEAYVDSNRSHLGLSEKEGTIVGQPSDTVIEIWHKDRIFQVHVKEVKEKSKM